MVIDSSVLLAIFFKEKHDLWAREKLKKYCAHLKMSTVNLTEVLILIRNRRPHLLEEIRDEIYASSIEFIPPTIALAEIAAQARIKYPLNLGDCFAYALAKSEKDFIITLDRDFSETDIEVICPDNK